MKTTTKRGGGRHHPAGPIAAELEADWRASFKASPYRSIATTDGGTIWSSPTITSTSTSTTITGSGWLGGTFTSATSWFPVKPTKPVRLTKAQKAMVMDAIAEQLVHPPEPHYKFIPWSHEITPYDEL